jgi:hypothetical protein
MRRAILESRRTRRKGYRPPRLGRVPRGAGPDFFAPGQQSPGRPPTPGQNRPGMAEKGARERGMRIPHDILMMPAGIRGRKGARQVPNARARPPKGCRPEGAPGPRGPGRRRQTPRTAPQHPTGVSWAHPHPGADHPSQPSRPRPNTPALPARVPSLSQTGAGRCGRVGLRPHRPTGRRTTGSTGTGATTRTRTP